MKVRSKPRGKATGARLSSGRQLLASSWQTANQHRRLFAKITAAYGVLVLFFVHGLSATVDLSKVQTSTGQVSKGFNVLTNLVGTSGTGSNQAASYYQSVFLVLLSLAVIYVLRQIAKAPKKLPSAKQAYYKSTGQFIPFVLMLLLISVQLLPMLIGASIYSLVIGNSLAVGAIENSIWLSLFLLLSIWSLYMVTASVFGLYIVFEPGRMPVEAWRSAKKLVAGKRWLVMRRLLFLPVVMLVAVTLVVLPFAIWLSPLAEWVYFVAGVLAVPFVHIYLYAIYLELK